MEVKLQSCPTTPSIPICSICRTVQSAYCCPRCSVRTCSLKCCLEHKSRTGCNGKRDRTAFCSLARFTDAQLASDFHFLEDVLKCGERAGRFVREEMGGAAGRGLASGRGKRHGRQHEQQPHQQQNGSLKDGNGPISPLLRLSVETVEEKNGTDGGGGDKDEKKSMAKPTTATKLDEREEGEVEEASTMKPAANLKEDADGTRMTKRQKLDDFMAKESSNNSITDSSSLLNICQPSSTSMSNEKDNTSNEQVANPITAAAATNNSNAASKVKVAEPEWLSRHPSHLRRLVRAAADRSTTLLLMPAGMARRKENTTTHSPKQNVIRWRIELRFHLRASSPSSVSSGNMVDASSNDNSDNLPASVITIFLDGIPESNKLSEIISAQLDVNPEGKNREARSKLRTMATMPRSSLHIITKVLPCPASRPVYTEIGSESSVADALAGLTVVEYPVFEIVKEGDLDKFPRKIEELSGAD